MLASSLLLLIVSAAPLTEVRWSEMARGYPELKSYPPRLGGELILTSLPNPPLSQVAELFGLELHGDAQGKVTLRDKPSDLAPLRRAAIAKAIKDLPPPMTLPQMAAKLEADIQLSRINPSDGPHPDMFSIGTILRVNLMRELEDFWFQAWQSQTPTLWATTTLANGKPLPLSQDQRLAIALQAENAVTTMRAQLGSAGEDTGYTGTLKDEMEGYTPLNHLVVLTDPQPLSLMITIAALDESGKIVATTAERLSLPPDPAAPKTELMKSALDDFGKIEFREASWAVVGRARTGATDYNQRDLIKAYTPGDAITTFAQGIRRPTLVWMSSQIEEDLLRYAAAVYRGSFPDKPSILYAEEAGRIRMTEKNGTVLIAPRNTLVHQSVELPLSAVRRMWNLSLQGTSAAMDAVRESENAFPGRQMDTRLCTLLQSAASLYGYPMAAPDTGNPSFFKLYAGLPSQPGDYRVTKISPSLIGDLMFYGIGSKLSDLILGPETPIIVTTSREKITRLAIWQGPRMTRQQFPGNEDQWQRVSATSKVQTSLFDEIQLSLTIGGFKRSGVRVIRLTYPLPVDNWRSPDVFRRELAPR